MTRKSRARITPLLHVESHYGIAIAIPATLIHAIEILAPLYRDTYSSNCYETTLDPATLLQIPGSFVVRHASRGSR